MQSISRHRTSSSKRRTRCTAWVSYSDAFERGVPGLVYDLLCPVVLGLKYCFRVDLTSTLPSCLLFCSLALGELKDSLATRRDPMAEFASPPQ